MNLVRFERYIYLNLNANEIFSLADVDGGLIGGASLNFSDFKAIVQAAHG